MRRPKISDLKIDPRGTWRMQQKMARVQKVKITIHFDSDLLESARSLAEEKGIPYQTFLNRLLRQTLEKEKDKEQDKETRLGQLEKEVEKIKKKLVV